MAKVGETFREKNSRVPTQTFPHQIPEKRGRNVHKKHTIKNTTCALKGRTHNEQLKQQCSSISCWRIWTGGFLETVPGEVPKCIAGMRLHVPEKHSLIFVTKTQSKSWTLTSIHYSYI